MKVIKSIYINDEVWILAEDLAKQNSRSISSLIEYLIKKEGEKNVDRINSKRTRSN